MKNKLEELDWKVTVLYGYLVLEHLDNFVIEQEIKDIRQLINSMREKVNERKTN